MQVIDASGNMFGYDSITVAGPDGKPKTLSSAIKLVSLVRNQTGATLTKGTIVYINGGSGNKPTVTKALATSDATSAQTYGVVQSNIANNKNGYVVVAGALDGLNTSAYAPGTQLYLSSTTAGEWTSTKQLAPAHLVYVGIVVRQHVNQGVVEVKIQNGYELDEIHDVQIVSPTNGQTLVYDSATSLWKNGTGGGGGASWGNITGTLSDQTDLQTALDAKQNTLVSGTSIKTLEGQSLLGSGNIDLTKSDVGLGNVDNTSDANKPISTATQTALNAKQNTLTLTTTGTSGAATLVGATLNIPQYSTTLNPSIISLSAVSATAVTGTTANSIASAILIPANTFGSTGIIDIMGRYQKTGTAGSQTLRLYVNTSASLTGATQVATFYTGANINAGAWRTANIFSNTINFYSLTGATNSDLGTNTGTPAIATFNTSVDNYIIFAVQLTNAADSCVLQYHKIVKNV